MFMKAVAKFVGLFAAVAVYSSVAVAATPNPECVKGARQDRHDCTKTCTEDFQISKDECRDVDHQCAEDCRAQFHACRQPLQDCIDGCNAQVRDNIQGNCPAPGDPARDGCIDSYQVQGFVCRDNCRESLHDQVKACKAARKSCVLSCPPPAPPAP